MPDDVWGIVFSKLEYNDRIRVMGVCRQWRVRGYEATSTSLVWQAGLSCQSRAYPLLQLMIVVMTRCLEISLSLSSSSAQSRQALLSYAVPSAPDIAFLLPHSPIKHVFFQCHLPTMKHACHLVNIMV